jgi:excinuclease ABC subunit B
VHSDKSSKEAQREELLRAQVLDMGEKDLAKEIKRLEKAMLEHAKNLQFEQAAQVRDQLARLREQVLGASGKDTLARDDIKATTL